MAQLQILNRGLAGRVLTLHVGVNRIGRHADCDFRIDDPTVSRVHCEIVLGGYDLRVRDCRSTNGTYIDGQAVGEAVLRSGQVLRFGDVECRVEDAEVRVSVPELGFRQARPPRVLANGIVCCPNHEDLVASCQCTHCKSVMCPRCVRSLRRRGGKTLRLCPKCSHPVQVLGSKRPRKRTLLGMLKTMKVPFARKPGRS